MMMISCCNQKKQLLAICLGLLVVIQPAQSLGDHFQFSSPGLVDLETNGGGVVNGRSSEFPAPPTIAPSSNPTATPYPTAPPTITPAPTETPTESPAPSPSPSEVPTMAPTATPKPTAAPSATPTESPAPSPSPSETPTMHPTVSAAPSTTPSLSMAPSVQPTPSPSDTPSGMPSDSPSNSPTISAAPSSTPSKSPTRQPSAMPSNAPTRAPSESPSSAPSASPSESPSEAPSVSASPTTSEPSNMPSMSPTEVSFKTKTGITNVMLMDLDREMTDEALAQFEVTTLQFIRDTQTATPGYNLDLLAVTVLTQDIVYTESTPDDGSSEESASGGRRNLMLSEEGLQVAFRMVGVVTAGSAPRDLDFSSIMEAGFEYHFGEFLHRLSIANDFFEPLGAHVDTTTLISFPEEDSSNNNVSEEPKRKKGTFVLAIMFAVVALLLAIGAVVYAVRKHLKKQDAKLQMLDYPGYGNHIRTKTLSDDDDERDEERGQRSSSGTVNSNFGKPPQIDIDDDKIEMEEIGLTPINASRPSCEGGTPVSEGAFSPNGIERGNGARAAVAESHRSSFGNAFGMGAGMKKWLTPRHTSRNSFARIDLNEDPPDSEIGFEVDNRRASSSRPPRQSIEPDALKASTRKAKGVFSDDQTAQEDGEKKNPKSMFTGNTPVGIPVSFFGQNSEEGSDTMSGNMGSTASSFFTKMGHKGSVFTGRKSMQSEAGKSTTSNNSKMYKFGSTGNKNRKSTNSIPEYNPFELNAANLAILQSASDGNIEASIAGSNFDEIRSKFESGLAKNAASAVKAATAPTPVPVPVPPVSKAVMANPETEIVFEKCDEQEEPVERARETKRTRTAEEGSVYSEQSELNLNDLGIEPNLGARPPVHNEMASRNGGSFAGHQYGSRPAGIRAPSSVGGARNQALAHQYQSKAMNGAKQTVPSGTRTIVVQEEKRRISLNTAIRQSDTYDVFAPAGPIGIVVDTSKMGPAVHSLKSTSPMLGLITPGDLIIALDNDDTRNMTAASLTRLMAKKSRQKERKITLLSPDSF